MCSSLFCFCSPITDGRRNKIQILKNSGFLLSVLLKDLSVCTYHLSLFFVLKLLFLTLEPFSFPVFLDYEGR